MWILSLNQQLDFESIVILYKYLYHLIIWCGCASKMCTSLKPGTYILISNEVSWYFFFFLTTIVLQVYNTLAES